MRKYPSDLTDRQWQVMEKTLCSKRKYGNPLRAVINALLYTTKSGCQWRMLPKEYPLWQSVYYYSGKWERNGTLEEVHDTLASDIRRAKGKKIALSVGIIDGQSSKRSSLGQENRGYDGGEEDNGHENLDVLLYIKNP